MLHQGLPVMMAWHVDGRAAEVGYRYLKVPGTPDYLTAHASVLVDYQVHLADNALLEAGTPVTDNSLLKRALERDVRFDFWRLQDSHGAYSVPNRRPNGTIDVSQAYFAGREPLCERKADGTKDLTKCTDMPMMLEALIPANVEAGE